MGICVCWCGEPLSGYPWLRNTWRGLLMTGAAICRDINIRGVNISHNNGGVNININIRGANWTFHHLQPLVPLSPTTWHLTHTASCIFLQIHLHLLNLVPSSNQSLEAYPNWHWQIVCVCVVRRMLRFINVFKHYDANLTRFFWIKRSPQQKSLAK